ncbi:MAG: efflux RND transporter periplasmic adaptor subunit [Calditrichaceae bacterium]|nr:efflux RND transporter periplasmic adaptor subunit [Calditrichaceae bacterium]
MKKILIFVLLIVVIGALVAIALSKKERGIEVTAEKVERGFVQQKVTGSGQIQPAVDVNVSAQVAGKIVELNAKEGDRVKKGELLVALDPRQYKAAVERSKSSLLSAKANEKKAKSDLSRAKDMQAKRLISDADFEGIEAQYESAKSMRMQAEATLEEANDALDKTKLYSTMDGIVTKLNKELGEMAIGAQFQEDVIMIVSDLSVMEALIEVDENDVINVSLGDTCEIELDAFPDTLFKGRVTEIANSAVTRGLGTQEQVTNFEITITLENPDNRFRPGMSTTVDIFTNRLDDVIKVPIQSVTVREKASLEKKESIEEGPKDEGPDPRESEMQEVVFVVEENRAIAKPVKLGISDDTHYAILSGINEEAEVITGPFKVLNKTLKNESLITIKSTK